MIDDYIYHFMPLGRPDRKERDIERVKAAVLQSKYFFGSPLDFNDPFDCKPNFRKDRRFDELRVRGVSEVLGRIGIFCAAEELYRTLMWSHYANGHRGVALQFSASQVRKAIEDIGFMDKVKYQAALPKMLLNGGDDLTLAKRVIFTKSRRWAYEKEVRIVLPDETKTIKSLPNMPVRNIYLGCKIDNEDQAELIDAFGNLPNRLFKLKMSSSRFAYSRKALKLDPSETEDLSS